MYPGRLLPLAYRATMPLAPSGWLDYEFLALGVDGLCIHDAFLQLVKASPEFCVRFRLGGKDELRTAHTVIGRARPAPSAGSWQRTDRTREDHTRRGLTRGAEEGSA